MTEDKGSSRAVAYYRSTIDDPDGTIDSQREEVREWAEKHGLQIIREFEDRDAARLDMEQHPGFDTLMRWVKKNRSFRYVLCPDAMRLECDVDLPEQHSDECLRAGKAVIYTKNTDCQIPQSLLPVVPVFLHSERLRYNDCGRTANKIRRRRVLATQEGYWPGGKVPYGLRRLLVDENGNPLHLLEPGERRTTWNHRVAMVPGEPAEVAAIRRIFREFADRGYSTARIAERLNAKQVPSPGGNGWTARHVRACLRATAYAAPIAYQRKRTRDGKGTIQWVRAAKAGEGIVGAELFRRAQERLGSDQHGLAANGGAGGIP